MNVKHFLTAKEYSVSELFRLIEYAITLKQDFKSGVQPKLLADKVLGMVFEKPSNRTRLSFEVGMHQLGGKAINIQAAEIGMGVREPVADVSRVFSRFVDAVMIRSYSHETIETFAKYSQVPVINGLSDRYHPCQAMGDMMTLFEHFGRLQGLRLVYVGDGNNNVCRSLIMLASMFDLNMVVSSPKGYEPQVEPVYRYQFEPDPVHAVTQADVIYTDVWTSMGQEEERQKRLRDFKEYTVTDALMAGAQFEAVFMHCLPAHRGEEVMNSVIEGKQSIVFDQAENRMHAQKAILAYLMMEDRAVLK